MGGDKIENMLLNQEPSEGNKTVLDTLVTSDLNEVGPNGHFLTVKNGYNFQQLITISADTHIRPEIVNVIL